MSGISKTPKNDAKPVERKERSFEPEAQKRILVVDDDLALAQLLNGFFLKAGFECEYTIKGKEAIEKYKELRPHLVLLDMLLPDITGFQVLRRMKESSFADKTHFLMMSGIMKDDKTVTEAKDKLKAHEFIFKPFNVKELNKTILKHLDLMPPEEEAEKEKPKVSAPLNLNLGGGHGKAPVLPEPQVMIEGGDLAQADMPRILCAFFTGKVTGVLKANSKEIVKVMYFEEGRPIFAVSMDPRDRFGEIIVRNGHVTQDQIDVALKKCGEPNRLGNVLVEMGLLQPSDLFNLIQLQVKEIILSTFAWSAGQYAFSYQDLARMEMVKLKTSPADLVFEGIRRHYTPDRLERLIVSRDRILAKHQNPQFHAQELHLGSSDLRVFNLINGERKISDIMAESKIPEVNVMQLLYGLIAMKIVEDKSSGH